MAGPSDDNLKALSDAVVRNAGNVMSIPSAGLIRHFKSRFVGESEQGLWLEAAHDAIPQIEELIAQNRPIAVSFKNSELRMSFASAPAQLDRNFRINAQTEIAAVLIKRPSEVKGIQRRAAYRVRVVPDIPLSIRIWSVAEQTHLSERPMATQEVIATIRDISIGGVGILLAEADAPVHRLIAAQRLRVEVKYDDVDMLVEGRLRLGPKVASSGATTAGIAFQKLEHDVEGRRKLAALTRIVGQLQRDEVRRVHMGLVS